MGKRASGFLSADGSGTVTPPVSPVTAWQRPAWYAGIPTALLLALVAYVASRTVLEAIGIDGLPLFVLVNAASAIAFNGRHSFVQGPPGKRLGGFVVGLAGYGIAAALVSFAWVR